MLNVIYSGDIVYHKILKGKFVVRKNWYGDKKEPIFVHDANEKPLAFERSEIYTKEQKMEREKRGNYPFVVYAFSYDWLKRKMCQFPDITPHQTRCIIGMLKRGRYDRVMSAYKFLKKNGVPIFMYTTSGFDSFGNRGEVIVLSTADSWEISKMVGSDGGHLAMPPKSPFNYEKEKNERRNI